MRRKSRGSAGIDRTGSRYGPAMSGTPAAIDVAMVLAAGLGKRMRPLTATIPKPLIAVDGRALLDHALDRVEEAGIETAIVNVHYLADLVEAHLRQRGRRAPQDGAVRRYAGRSVLSQSPVRSCHRGEPPLRAAPRRRVAPRRNSRRAQGRRRTVVDER